MKHLNRILGPMAVVLGLGLSRPAEVLAQGTATKVETAAPVAAPAAATTLDPIVVWDSQTADGAEVGVWGNGAVARNGTTFTATTRNLEEGIRFDLKKPVELAPFQRTGWWRLRVQINAAPNGGRGRNQPRGGAPVAGAVAPLTQLRLKLILDNGAMSGLIPLAQPAGNRGRGNGWQNLLLAVRNMNATRGASGAVRRIILTGDSTATFGIEQVALVAETAVISATVRRSTDPVGTDLKDITLKPGRGAIFVADVNSGTSDVLVSWNFNADNSPALPPLAARGAAAGGAVPGARPGAAGAPVRRIDAVGTTARPDWPNEEEDYRVEVTITDRAGRKPAVRKSFAVKVRAYP